MRVFNPSLHLINSHSHYYRSLAKNVQKLDGKVATGLSKLHSTLPEVIFGKIMFFLKKMIIRTIFLRHWAKLFWIIGVFFLTLFKILNLHNEDKIFIKSFFSSNWFSNFVRMLVINFWQAYEYFQVLVSNGIFGL